MCGICGFNWEDRNLIKKMTSILKHRGPDDKGYYITKNLSLGHRRLSIIDLKTGKQPIYNEDKSIVIIFNGEIYNYKELKQELENKNHKFYTDTDTEVLVHLYEEYPINKFLNKLNGMFAFAIYDSKKKLLLLARDRLGIKPLYYYFNNKKFMFSSEIKSILLDKEIKREVNKEVLKNYLTFRFIPWENTLFKNIKKLLPGYYLIYKNKKIIAKKYWDLSYNIENRSENYFIKKLKQELTESIKKRLMSDVPLGAFLSGGIDSSTIVALMSKLTKEPVKTFSVGFGTSDPKEELKPSKLIADYFNTDHKEIIVKENTSKLLPKIIYHYDEPLADPASIPLYIMSKYTKKKATVALIGEGADEQLAGYMQYKFMLLNKKFKFIPNPIKKTFVKLIPKSLLNKFFKYTESLGEEGLKRFNKFISDVNDKAKSYLDLVSIFNKDELLKLGLNYDISKKLNQFYFNNKNHLLSQLLYLENKTLIPEDRCLKVDKMTMAHSIEARVPFLDHKLVEFATSLPVNLKLKFFTEKYILRKAMKPYLPKFTIKRKKERFFVPIDSWFKGELMDIAKNLLSKENISKHNFNYNYIQKIFNNYKKSKLFYSRQLWTLITYELWYKIYIEQEKIHL